METSAPSLGAGSELSEATTLRLQRRLDEYMTNMKRRLGLEALGLGPFLPPHVFELVRGGLLEPPEELCLEHNHLEGLPPDDLPLLSSHLRALLCADNRIYSLPKQIASLTALQRLELDRNALTAFPAGLGQLKQLTFLSVNSNQIGELPASIGELESLETLHISSNNLTYLPLEMGRLTRLQELAIDNNKFAFFPPVVPQIVSLKALSFAFNDSVKEIAPLNSLTRLEKLHVEEGKRFGIPRDLVPSGPNVIFLYLSTLGKFPGIHIDLEQHWIPDEQASKCAICQANFTTLFRKHHCRMCGRVTCKKCTGKRHSVPANPEGAHRVCDECHNLLSSPYPGANNPKAAERVVDEWGLTESDKTNLSADQQKAKLAEQLTKINGLISSKTSSKAGLEKLVGFYAKDPVAQKKAMTEVQQLSDLLSSLAAHRATIIEQLQALGGQVDVIAQPTEPTPPSATQSQASEGMKAKMLYTFQAQTEGEITVVAGALVTLLDEQPNGEWWLIEYTGRSGYVPATYLSPVF